MENKHIKDLMSAMENSGTTKIHLKKQDFEITIERESIEKSHFFEQDLIETSHYRPNFKLQKANTPLPSSQDPNNKIGGEELVLEEKPGSYITSPMVGIFFSANSPEDPAFIKVGDKIEKGAVVCIIEAMKVMNEIKSTETGNVVEILVDNSSPVEFGTKLFRIQSL